MRPKRKPKKQKKGSAKASSPRRSSKKSTEPSSPLNSAEESAEPSSPLSPAKESIEPSSPPNSAQESPKASSPLSSAKESTEASSPLDSAIGALGNLAQLTVSNVLANGIEGIGEAISGTGKEALDAVVRYEELQASLDALVARELVNTGGAKDMAEGFGLARDRSADLSQWMQQLAVSNPISEQGIADTFRQTMAFGFTTKEAQRLTQAFTEFSVGGEKSQDSILDIGEALGEIKKHGTLAEEQVSQLAKAGIPVKQILATSMGTSTDEIQRMTEKGSIPANVAIEAIAHSLEVDFGGAAKRQSNTIGGLLSRLSNIKEVGLREFFTGTFSAIQPYLERFVAFFSNPATLKLIRDFGNKIGEVFGMILSVAEELFKVFKNGGIDAVIEKLVGDIGKALIDNWPAISKTLSEWATKFWSWITDPKDGVIKKASDKLNELITWIGKWLDDNWPTISKHLKEWSTKFWNWVTDPNDGVLVGIAGAMNTLSDKLREWSESEDGKARLGVVGESIGGALIEGLSSFFRKDKNGKITGFNIGDMLWNAADSLSKAVSNIGGTIAGGIVKGIAEPFLGPTNAKILGEAVSKTVGDATHIVAGPGGPMVQGPLALVNTFTMSWQTAMSSASGITSALTGALGGAMTAAKNMDWFKTGSDIIGKINDGAASIVYSLQNTITGPLLNAWTWITGNDWFGLGNWLLDAVARGMEEVKDRLSAALQGPLQKVIDALWAVLHTLGIWEGPSALGPSMSALGMGGGLGSTPSGMGASMSFAPSYNLTIVSQAKTEQVAADFMLMKAMAGAS